MAVNASYLITGVLIVAYCILQRMLPAFAAAARTYKVVFLCGLACLNLWVYHVRAGEYEVDRVSPSAKSLEALRRELPSRGYVGFISDGKILASHSSLQRYFVTQYELAPIVVDQGADADLVVVSVEKFVPGLIPQNLVMLRDFGDGIMLFGKRRP